MKKQNFEEVKYTGAIYNENSNTNGKKKNLKKNDKNNNTIDIDEIDPDPNNKNRFKKIIITNKSKILKDKVKEFKDEAYKKELYETANKAYFEGKLKFFAFN